MRGIPSLITDIRKTVFAEVARMAYSGDCSQMEDIPYRIVPGDSPLHRESVFLERAIAGERVRLAMGTIASARADADASHRRNGHAAIAEQYYEPPLVIHSLRLSCLSDEALQRDQYLSGAVWAASCPERVPQGRDFLCKRQERLLTKPSASAAASARAPAPTTPSRSSNAPVRRRAAWTPSGLTKTARRGLIMIAAFPAGSAL